MVLFGFFDSWRNVLFDGMGRLPFWNDYMTCQLTFGRCCH